MRKTIEFLGWSVSLLLGAALIMLYFGESPVLALALGGGCLLYPLASRDMVRLRGSDAPEAVRSRRAGLTGVGVLVVSAAVATWKGYDKCSTCGLLILFMSFIVLGTIPLAWWAARGIGLLLKRSP